MYRPRTPKIVRRYSFNAEELQVQQIEYIKRSMEKRHGREMTMTEVLRCAVTDCYDKEAERNNYKSMKD